MSSLIPENQSSDKITQLQHNFWELNVLFELSRALNYASDIYSLAEGFIDFLKNQLSVRNIAFYVLDGEKYHIISYDDVGLPCPAEFENAGEGIWRIIEEGQPVQVADTKGKCIYSQFFDRYNLHNLNSYYWLPILNEGRVITIISIGPKNETEPYSELELKTLAKVCEYMTPAISRVQTQQAKERNINYLQKSLHNISILYNLGQAINFIDDLKRLLKIILDKAIQTVSAEKGSLMLYDNAYNELIVKVVHGLPDKEIEDKINEGLIQCTRIKVGEGIAGEVFHTKKPIITNLGSSDPRFKQSSNSRVSSILCVPLVVKGEAIGVINITNKLSGGFFNHDDLDFMVSLANHAAIAISNAQLYELATKDGLTKLYIYRHFQYMLDSEIKRSARYKHSVSLLMMDIDNFKQINDAHGHQIGDEILRVIANVISSTCRKIDMPSRYGGEEFAVILPETSTENARKIADRIRRKVEAIAVTTENTAKVVPTISIGISTYPDLANSQESLIGSADKALYFAKEKGKNCVAEFSPDGCTITCQCENKKPVQGKNSRKK
ncbi:MAG: hypothetical protein A2287_08355 [Candidatus Melainabacteria bacterium RIFOXYA12_FULL_32_12]|nr:MAG: hypothetical protein A2255_06610 [Candidatus Melainabacteria bacterium RIFOXYA2_FULL_32_9]OGI26320.1 MAG: hypothetical protein A2287_08355 [Candidatus Melainabacteria bacterium RIFOXYA12_FULL_32_12]